jgi:hypothetical protein
VRRVGSASAVKTVLGVGHDLVDALDGRGDHDLAFDPVFHR